MLLQLLQLYQKLAELIELTGVLIWCYGAQNSASDNLFANYYFCGGKLSAVDWGSIPGYVYTTAQSDIESSGGIDL